MLKDLTLLKKKFLESPLVKKEVLSDFKIPESLKLKLQESFSDKGYCFNDYTSYAITSGESNGNPANYAIIPNQYFVFASEMYELAVELYKYLSIFDKIRSKAAHLVGSSEEIKIAINSNSELRQNFDSEEDIVLFSRFLDKDNDEYRLKSKRLINYSGIPRGASDCFSSAILKVINLPDSSSSIFGHLVYDLVEMPDVFSKIEAHWSHYKKISSIVKLSSITTSVTKTIRIPEFIE